MAATVDGTDPTQPRPRAHGRRHAARHRDPAEHRLRPDRRAAADRGPVRPRRADGRVRPDRCRRDSSWPRRMPRRRRSWRRRSAVSPWPAAPTTSTLALAQAIICGVAVRAPRGVQARLPRELPVEADPGRVRRRARARHPGEPGREDARREDRLRRRVRRQGRRAVHRPRHDQLVVGADLGRVASRCSCSAGGSPGRCRGRWSCWSSPPSSWWSPTSTTPASPCSARCDGRTARR